MSTRVPQGVSAEVFEDAKARMRAVVGRRWVIDEESQGLASYYDIYSPASEMTTAPSAAVAPANVEELQRVVVIAHELGIPLWTTSAGKNYAYGGPAPREAGMVVLDLKRMNRVLEVDTESAYAVVEPGVSYFQLYEHLQKNKIPLWIDCAAPGWGSVLGNASERGVGYTPYGDHWMMQCGLEVMLADGTLFRTGMGAMENSNTWNLFKYGYGPYLDGIFSQSNFGIITKMGIWLMPEPPGHMPFMITLPREDDLHMATDILRPLKINMVIPNGVLTPDLIWESATKVPRSKYYTGKGPMPDSARKKMAKDLDMGQWNVIAGLYGPQPIIDANWGVIRDAFAKIPGAKFYTGDDRPGDVSWEYRKKLMRGEPNLTEFNLMNWVGGGGHVNFSPISPTTGDDAVKQYEMIRSRAHEYGFDYMGEFAVGWREMHHIFMLMFNRTDEAETKRAYELFSLLIDEAAAEGYGEYRTNLHYMDHIAKTYGYNDDALWKLHRRIKRALDPKGILSPGKQGIWPLES
ncbi:MAG: FAD-binding oxidoreductase [Gammaproteobacteria bacterium]|nr:FAD-binding oxidoreductase [Gammaproteobacteria bacterium]